VRQDRWVSVTHSGLTQPEPSPAEGAPPLQQGKCRRAPQQGGKRAVTAAAAAPPCALARRQMIDHLALHEGRRAPSFFFLARRRAASSLLPVLAARLQKKGDEQLDAPFAVGSAARLQNKGDEHPLFCFLPEEGRRAARCPCLTLHLCTEPHARRPSCSTFCQGRRGRRGRRGASGSSCAAGRGQPRSRSRFVNWGWRQFSF